MKNDDVARDEFGKSVVAFMLFTLLVAGIAFPVGSCAGEQWLARDIAEGRATVEKHTFADGSTEVRIIWK